MLSIIKSKHHLFGNTNQHIYQLQSMDRNSNTKNYNYSTSTTSERRSSEKYNRQKTFIQTIIKQKSYYPSVSALLPLEKMVEEYKNKDMIKALETLKQQFKMFRKIRGDGNCFIRAFAFNYLILKAQVDFDRAFLHIQKLDLRAIQNVPHLRSLKDKYYCIKQNQSLKDYFRKTWMNYFIPNLEQSNDYSNSLVDFMNLQFADMMIILYFRALCVDYFEKNKEKYSIFYISTDQFQKIERALKTYGQESEGFIMKCMADTLQCTCIIAQVDKKNGCSIMKFEPDELTKTKPIQVHLFFRPGHYDVLAQPVILQQQKMDLEKQKTENNPCKKITTLANGRKQENNQPSKDLKKDFKSNHVNKMDIQEEPRQMRQIRQTNQKSTSQKKQYTLPYDEKFENQQKCGIPQQARDQLTISQKIYMNIQAKQQIRKKQNSSGQKQRFQAATCRCRQLRNQCWNCELERKRGFNGFSDGFNHTGNQRIIPQYFGSY